MKTKAANPSHHLQGKDAPGIIELYFDICHLKQLYRQGWLQSGIALRHCESVAEHCFGVAMLAMFLADRCIPDLDTAQVLRLALLHDFGEIYAGDLTPQDGVPRAEKIRREQASVAHVLRRLPGGDRYFDLWREYESGSSPEARFVRQVEKLEMALQASVYEHQKLADLETFFTSAKQGIEHGALREILAAIEDLRQKVAETGEATR